SAAVRKLSSLCFAELVDLVPFDTIKTDTESGTELDGARREAHSFLGQLGGIRKESEEMGSLNVDLREYQRDGVSWLCFLGEFGLGAALCDDMGLGKTLQTLCAIECDRLRRAGKGSPPLPSIVVCPSILVAHWEAESKRFFPERKVCVVKAPNAGEGCPDTLFIASYDAVSKSKTVAQTRWSYCVCDEAHFMRSPHSKKTLAAKSIKAETKVALTGTPIQNDVVELWSLFDFLMPGFLGDLTEFTARYSKPIQRHRRGKHLRREERKSVDAMLSLQKKIEPFVLRRLKEDVLPDLPEKTIQDYYCEMAPLQKTLYEKTEDPAEGAAHVFSRVRKQQALCLHPVLSTDAQDAAALRSQAELDGKETNDAAYSGKMTGLRDLLQICGLGEGLSQNRFLVFAQSREALGLVEEAVLRRFFPQTVSVCLDAAPTMEARYSSVVRFNEDPSIDILLATTAVGGHGLNLTGANVVVFVEHSWNPQTDLQAMDRAHRLGQKRSVNVYRLVLRDTIEEQVMDLQHFKMRVASTVVRQQEAADPQKDISALDMLDILRK
ncbi:MAG: TATA-binding protein associated factor Mot1, partial [Amphiamblys sp. WSBS2006]